MIIKKYKCKQDGYRWDPNKKKCVRMSQDEIRKRKLAAKKAAKTRKAHKTQILKKILRTKKLNKNRNIQRKIIYK